MILDNLGITVLLKNLEGWDNYRAAEKELFGEGRLSRFWNGWIYPALRPTRYLERKQRFEAERARMQQQFLVAVLEEANETA